MKKIVILLSMVMLVSGAAYASKYPKYDAELSKIRTIKNAQTSVINEEISDLATKIENLELDTTISAAQKNAQLKEYNKKIEELTAKKIRIADKYNADKKRLKILYKHK